MQFFADIAAFVVAAFVGGVAMGVVVHRSLNGRRIRIKEIRWRRELDDSNAENQKEIETLQTALHIVREKEHSLLKALKESDETVHLLSADRRAGYEKDVAERNSQIAELSSRLSHARATIEDAKDQETVLRKKIEELSEQQQRRDTLLSARDNEIRHLHAMQDQRIVKEKLQQRDEHIATLKEQFESLRQQLPSLNDALREREESIEDLLTALSDERRKTHTLEQSIANSSAIEKGPIEIERDGDKVIRIQQAH
ncbi:MAG: hypothetical protein KJO35_08945, partial [Gammaproteobacteria bacterium]|nr:hypothetical protein [Gammaproteobacteria bacterium]